MTDATTAPNVVTHRHPRTNGWDCPWHPYQLIVWTVVLLFTLSHYGFLVFYFPPYWIYLGYIVPGFVFLVHVCASIVTSTIDPADPSLRCKSQRGEATEGPGFDRSQHEHVIENLHCHICDTDVGIKTKHCRLCDKCVSNFDHHCKWINNCVGSRNYKLFIVTLVSALLGVVLMVIVCLTLFVTFFAARDQLRYFCDVPGNATACDPTLRILAIAVPDPVFPTVVAILGLLAVVGTGLIGHLTIFHFYLIFRGITTYDYIVEQRNEPPSPRCSIATKICSCAKTNRVTPSAMEEGILGSEQTSSEEFTSSHDSAASKNSSDSAGMVTFGRTPPHSDDEDRPLPLSEQPNTFAKPIIGSVSAQNGIQLSSLGGTEVAMDSCQINTSNNNNSSEVAATRSTKETLNKKDGNMTQIFVEPPEGFVSRESLIQNVSKSFPAFFPHALSPADANLLPGSRNTSLVLPSPDAHSSFTTSPFVHQALRANDTSIPKLQIQDEETDSQTYYTAQTPDRAHGIAEPSPNNVILHRTDGHDNLLTSQCLSPVLPPFIESPVEYAALSCTSSTLHEYSQPLDSISHDNSVTTVNSSSQAMIISPRPYSMKPKKVVSFSNILVGDTKPTESDSTLQAPSPPPLPPLSDEPILAHRNHRPLPPLSSSAPDDVSSLGSYESLHSSSSMVSLTSYNRRYSRRSQSLASSLTSLNGESTKRGKRRTRNHRADSLTKLESEWKQNRLLCPLPETKPTND